MYKLISYPTHQLASLSVHFWIPSSAIQPVCPSHLEGNLYINESSPLAHAYSEEVTSLDFYNEFQQDCLKLFHSWQLIA